MDELRPFRIFKFLCAGFRLVSRCEVASISGAGGEAQGATADSMALQALGSVRLAVPLLGFHT